MRQKRLAFLAIAAIVTCAAPTARGDVKLPRIFSNHMVLQRGLATPIWGSAKAGEKITVRFGDQEQTTTCGDNGQWSVRLNPLEASNKGRSLEVQGANKIVFRNVLVGDVWICSGQSNMEWSVRASLNSREEIAQAKFPQIRLFDVPGHTTSPLPRNDVPGGSWRPCTPQTVANFSAVGYYFGRKLHREMNVPIGLIGTNWGGTRIEPWTPPVGFRSVPQLKKLSEMVDRFDATTPAGKNFWSKHIAEVEQWVADAQQALATGKSLPTPIETPGFRSAGQPTAIYNAMVHGLAPYGVRGAIWYQGESNGNEGISYHHKMRALINGWRQVWGQGDDFPFYFYYVQLADWQRPNDNPAGGNGWARLREAQRKTLEVPHTGMAVIIDIGQADNIHPRNKQDVGKRLARWALRDVAKKDVVVSGPLYREMKIEGNKIRLHFDHVGGGLIVGQRKKGLEPTPVDPDGKLQRFAIAGQDKKWHWADARIDGETVVVSSDKVAKPVAVRYAYSMNPAGANLYNKEGLPASPFRTDAW